MAGESGYRDRSGRAAGGVDGTPELGEVMAQGRALVERGRRLLAQPAVAVVASSLLVAATFGVVAAARQRARRRTPWARLERRAKAAAIAWQHPERVTEGSRSLVGSTIAVELAKAALMSRLG